MQLIVQGKNIQVTDRLREYVETKVDRLDRYLATITDARMELASEQTRRHGDRQIAQLTIHSKGMMLRAEERSGDIFTSVDMVLDKMKRQIDRYKRKRRGRLRGAQAREIDTNEFAADLSEEDELEERTVDAEDLLDEINEDDEEGLEGAIVRIKRFQVSPMDPEEAIEQMELLGHDFFVFYNADGGQFNVVYRRRDGNYGLIQPEID
jgi:putative sigma-54 modulation protein